VRTAYVCDLPMTHRIGMWWQLAALASAPSTARRQRAEKESYICSLLRAESEYVWRTCVMKRIFRSTVYAWTFRGAVMLMTEGGGRAHLHLACGTARKLHRRGRVPNPVRTSLTACMVFICCYRQLPHRACARIRMRLVGVCGARPASGASRAGMWTAAAYNRIHHDSHGRHVYCSQTQLV